MSNAVFYLDEDANSPPSSSPRALPLLETRPNPIPTATATATTSPPATLHVPSLPQPAVANTALQPQHRKHPAPFAATPSFSSPLARAIIVPSQSDTSSSGSHSDLSEDEQGSPNDIRAQLSPTLSASSGTPGVLPCETFPPRARTASPSTCSASRSASPASTQRAATRPPSPIGLQGRIVTPGTLLQKGKRSGSVSALAGSLPSPTSRDSPPRSATKTDVSLMTSGSRVTEFSAGGLTSSQRTRSGSGGSILTGTSSPLAFGSPELCPSQVGGVPDLSTVGSASVREAEPNILGLGWEANWETASLGSPVGRDKGKTKDTMGPPSPRRQDRTGPPSIARQV
jgi:serine/threonine-protein kinase RIM15